jgi:hypothetical protein
LSLALFVSYLTIDLLREAHPPTAAERGRDLWRGRGRSVWLAGWNVPVIDYVNGAFQNLR